jgi:hypothetical protein
MGSGLASEPLPAMATFVMSFTLLPFVLTLWFYSRSLLSWALATALVLGFQFGISVGFGANSPLPAVAPSVAFSNTLTQLGIDVILCFVWSMTASLMGLMFDIAELLPFGALFPRSQASRGHRSKKEKMDENTVVVQNAPLVAILEPGTGLRRWGMHNLPRPWVHVIVTIFLLLITVALPFILFGVYMDDAGNDDKIALSTVIIIPVIGYLLCAIFWYFYCDPYIWGPHKNNISRLGNKYAHKNQQPRIHQDTAETNRRIIRTILTIAVFHIAGAIVMGLIRYFRTDVNFNWIAGFVVLLIVLLIILLVWAILYFTGRSGESTQATPILNEVTTTDQDDSIGTTAPNDNASIEPVATEEIQSRFNQHNVASQQLNRIRTINGVKW